MPDSFPASRQLSRPFEFVDFLFSETEEKGLHGPPLNGRGSLESSDKSCRHAANVEVSAEDEKSR